MTNEATQVEGPYEIHDYTIADESSGTDRAQGSLMELIEPRTAQMSVGDGVAFAGILATEKKGGNGKTEIGLWTTGTFIMKAATVGPEGAIDAGDPVVLSGANLIRAAVAGDLLTGAVIGRAKEDIAAAGTGEVTLSGFGG